VRAKNDAGMCYKAEGFFGGADRKECQKVGQYTFYYTCCEEGAPDHPRVAAHELDVWHVCQEQSVTGGRVAVEALVADSFLHAGNCRP